MGITASENFSSKSVNFAVSKSVRRGLMSSGMSLKSFISIVELSEDSSSISGEGGVYSICSSEMDTSNYTYFMCMCICTYQLHISFTYFK